MSSVETMLGVQPAARDVEWIKGALSCAITLEHATIPPYLCALWSIKPRGHAFRQIFKGVVLEEMGHMGLAANMLAGLGGSPPIGDPGFVPSYPTPLPCGIVPQHKPDLIIPLQGFSIAAVTEVFLNIEYPEKGPVAIEEAVWVPPLTHSIGEFYYAIRGAFLALDPAPTFQTDKQLTVTFGGNPNNLVFQVTSVADAVRAIDQIREQGEGTEQSADAEMFGMELAHYYKFLQITEGHMFVPIGGGKWKVGAPIPPLTPAQVWPMAPVPAGGYSGAGVPPEIAEFNATYKEMLANLKLAWSQGGSTGEGTLGDAINQMIDLESLAVAAMKVPIGAGPQTYGPTFQDP